MEYNNEQNIKCPYCGWEDNDSWEYDEDESIVSCGSCEKEFNATREIEVTYSTSRIKCKEGKHNYQLDTYHVQKRKYVKGGNWEELSESEWEYFKIEVCDICDNKEFVDITKAEYEKKDKK